MLPCCISAPSPPPPGLLHLSGNSLSTLLKQSCLPSLNSSEERNTSSTISSFLHWREWKIQTDVVEATSWSTSLQNLHVQYHWYYSWHLFIHSMVFLGCGDRCIDRMFSDSAEVVLSRKATLSLEEQFQNLTPFASSLLHWSHILWKNPQSLLASFRQVTVHYPTDKTWSILE